MFNLSNRLVVLPKFLASGVGNTILGFAVIVVLMLAGVHAIAANIAGYAAGLVCSFTLNRRFVFVTRGNVSLELARFLIAFGISFAANLVFLHYAITALGINRFAAQVLSAAVYTSVMFALCSAFVFKDRRSA